MAKKVLIIEDDFALGQSLQEMLKFKGFESFFAADGPAGLDLARKEKPDVVLLDIMLPRIGGFELCRMLRTDSKTSGAKVIMITGLGRMADVEKAFSCGASDYLIKPFDVDRLVKKIKKVLGIDQP